MFSTLVETFLHDGLNRPASSEIADRPAKTVTYNVVGNIVTKSDGSGSSTERSNYRLDYLALR